MTRGVPLRDYQEECLGAILTRFAAGVRRQLVVLPTGAGKTVVAAHLPARMGWPATLFLVHREELVRQAVDTFRASWPGLEVGVERAGERSHGEPVVVASVQTVSREPRLSEVSSREWGLVVVDEAHHAVASSYRRIISAVGASDRAWKGLLLGITATSRRGDGVGLRPVFDEVVYSRTMLDMIEAGYLVPVRGFLVRTGVSISGVRVRRGDFDERQLSAAVNTPHRNETQGFPGPPTEKSGEGGGLGMPGRTLWHPEDVRALASAILEDLTVDTILTVGQIRRRYGVQRDLVRAACKLLGETVEYRTIGLRPAANAYREIRVEVVCLDRVWKLSRVPYLLGLAEMRTALFIPGDRWAVLMKNPWKISPRFLPSVTATDEEGNLLAVEYDCGKYTRPQLVSRHRVLAACGIRVVWGVPGLRRAVSVAEMLPGAEVWHVSWETGVSFPVQKDGKLLVTPETLASDPGLNPSKDWRW